ncbi:polysaccharide biosynthesis tyrosine autokinase [Candidatus Dependentiae bacterium]|nr:polysaccharide biosynthesis tyrosine autokinase [Candidatus Dependentiae bacterium]
MSDQNLDLSIHDLFGVLRKNLFWVVISGALVLLIFILVALLSPAQYQTTMKIRIGYAEESRDLMLSSFPWYWNPTIVNNEVEVLRTMRMAKLISDSLPEETKDLLLPSEGLTASEREYKLAKLVNGMIVIEMIQETDIIKIKAYAYDPSVAFTVLETLKKVYLSDNLEEKKRSIIGIRKFLGVQSELFKSKLEIAEKKLEEYKRLKGVAYLGSESIVRIQRMAEFEAQYYTAKTEYSIKQKNLTLLSERLSDQRLEALEKISSISTPMINELKSRIVNLEIEKTSLQVLGYSSDHPKLKLLDTQIADLKEKLQDSMSDSVGGVYGIDPVSIYQKDLESYMSLQIEVEVLSQKIIELEKIIDSYKESMKGLPEDQIEILRLTRDLEVNEKIYLMLKEKYEEARIKEAGQLGDLRVIDGPNYPMQPFKPRRKLLIIFGIITGVFFGFGVGILKELVDFRIKTPEDFNRIPEIKVLGVIPKAGRKLQSRNFSEFERKISTSDLINNFTMIRKNVQLIRPDEEMKKILVTSTLSGAGKSTFVVNLAISFAKLGKKVIIVDCDLRKPVVHQFFNIEIKPGIVDYILDSETLLTLIKRIEDYNIDVLTAGSTARHPVELLESKKFKTIFDELLREYDYILIDSAPILAVPDAAVLSSIVDCTILVEEAGKTSKDLILAAKKILDSLNCSLSGVVLNKVQIGRGKYYYRYRSYH